MNPSLHLVDDHLQIWVVAALKGHEYKSPLFLPLLLGKLFPDASF